MSRHMDEIFNLSALKNGIPVVIFGYEFSLEDLMSLEEERPKDIILAAQKKLSKIDREGGVVPWPRKHSKLV